MIGVIVRHKENKELIGEVLQSHVMPFKASNEEGQVEQGFTTLCNVVWFKETEDGIEPYRDIEECPSLESAKLLTFEALDWDDFFGVDDSGDETPEEIEDASEEKTKS